VKKEILVYVIEDDESVRRAFAILLQSAGFHVQVFSSADEFLEWEVLSDNSCIILDMRMPGISGLEFLKKLASRSNKPHVIVVSAYDDGQTLEIATELGAIAFFRKPVDGQALIDTILWAIADKKKDKRVVSGE
jgi:FixJ family two-component response regulator